MELSFSLLFIGILSLAVGSVLGYLARQSIAKKQLGTAEGKVNKMITDAEAEAQSILLTAKNKAVEVLEDVKKEEKKRQEQIFRSEKRIESREENLDRKLDEVERGRSLLIKKAEEIKKIRKESETARQEQLKRLEKIANLSKEDAKKVLLQLAEEQNREFLAKQIKKLEQQSNEELVKKARDIMTSALQRYAGSHAAETTTSTVSIPSDEIKGRIIGREGRNIKTLERLTGIEVIVDDTPEAIVLSGFNPVRREIARLAIEKLIADGRIHPTRIEEAINFAKTEVNNKIKEAGEAAAYDVGIAGLDPKLIQILGRLRFRTSYGQNVLLHSLEVAHLSGALAAELGADVNLAKKAGLLHDIGKAIDHEVQGTHIEIGMNILKKFGIGNAVINAMKSHHEDFPFESNEAMIIAAADALSASRPGARKDTLEDYLKRLGDLENVAQSFPAVEKSYAIQAGREIRVFVKPEEVDDLGAIKLAREIADKIEQELKYPGEIKVNVLRETRAVEVAR
ncbi:MAG: Ribonuclease Y [Candidatus Moranbacteria bacterium GW2011_GWC1_45_18]|nr:MAG: Ribonuclease Y [Candidatus Moranbacteria bacterium GW2011_GWC2_40_12]KKT34111.1 MAG: Ribonuclease Y [Candidatus Moranbacteria bacterium GW2011_GWF2_44_10]KKT69807.1 MAG: Ribonuclease Y [Candidatus Moranbacteria bacterium GW2011_GWF1_44_4]KKU00676.1 MAG: Ribonuclease Y [Candidatus Moranbacteria bacterium GW2011_GWC1_45_18]OGI24540.1 MAG: ribonuclease Y [Candidatus Moranbacteria bacterium RIFOXYA1_FULL_44_8]OGI36095.1 MAG: ribonuclease Y [Candidatus Moranbacteria bacterium RIFOXYC1_FULL_